MKIMMITLLFLSSLFAELKIGDGFPVYNLVDQFENKMAVKQIGETTLILSFEKDVSSGIKKFLDTKKKSYLEENSMMYISDISSMPSFITNWFAIPKMKKFNFKIALINDDKVGDIIPRKDSKVTIIKLKNNGIETIEFVEPKELNTTLP